MPGRTGIRGARSGDGEASRPAWFRVRTSWGDFTALLGPDGVREMRFPRGPGARAKDSLPDAAKEGGRIGARLTAALNRRLAGKSPLEVPLAPAYPTSFVARVCEELRRIPCGQVRSYGEIARRIGERGAARAVGGACGRNPVCVFIPCHRVVAADGIGGFSAHKEFKRRLLGLEGATGERAGTRTRTSLG